MNSTHLAVLPDQQEFQMHDNQPQPAPSGRLIGWGELDDNGKVYHGKIVETLIGKTWFFYIEVMYPGTARTSAMYVPVCETVRIKLSSQSELIAMLDSFKADISYIQKIVASYFGFSISKLLSDCREDTFAKPRMMAMLM